MLERRLVAGSDDNPLPAPLCLLRPLPFEAEFFAQHQGTTLETLMQPALFLAHHTKNVREKHFRYRGNRFMIALPLFALGAASILSGLALVGTEVRQSNQQGGETKWTLLDATAAVLVLGGMFGLWLLGSFLAMDQTLATNSWLLGKALFDATMVIFGAKILVGSRRLVHEPLLAAVCVAGIGRRRIYRPGTKRGGCGGAYSVERASHLTRDALARSGDHSAGVVAG
jgi:hypothetical protein